MAQKNDQHDSVLKAQSEPAAARADGLSHRAGLLAGAWQRLREFSGIGGNATYFWTRWLVLRAVGVVFLFVFAGILAEGQAILAPNGIAQLGELLDQARKTFPSAWEQFIRVPSLFWLSQSPAMISALGWAGLAAAIGVVVNWWPRASLALCWVFFLSFASAWRSFSPAQLDGLMLEAAVLCIAFAPAGVRPGLGLHSPPRPIALFMMRWFLIRVMLENGIVKIASGDPRWRDGTAMETLYETCPFPTILGYLDHQLPLAYHWVEIALTFFAELVAPVIAVFGGRRERWIAFASWFLLQAGIQLTCNFGWLNTAAIGAGLLLLDDQMLAAAAERLRWRETARRMRAAVADVVAVARAPWKTWVLRVVLSAHCYITVVWFTKACGVPPSAVPAAIAWPAEVTKEFRSANGYYLYATFESVRFQVEFEGSNDDGRSWRAYPYPHIPQQTDRLCGFIAPRFLRFEATMEIEGWSGRKSPVFSAVAAHLLAGNANVIARFARDPFAGDKPPTLVRIRGYRMAMTTLGEWQRTGKFWRREPDGEYAPILRRTEAGEIEQMTLVEANAALAARSYGAAFELLKRDYETGSAAAGLRLAEMSARGAGAPADPARALEIYRSLAKEGEVTAEFYLGTFWENGIGTSVDFEQAKGWFQRAAARDYLPAIFSLGALYANQRVTPSDDIGGLALLLEAGERAAGSEPKFRVVRENQPELVRRMKARMTPEQIMEAEHRLRARPPRRGLRPLATLDRKD